MTRRLASARALAVAFVVVAGAAVAGGAFAGSEANGSITEKVILFASDGMRPDLVDKYAAQGAMPTMADLSRGRQREERPSAGLSAQHRSGLGEPRNRGVAGYSRLHEQHLLPNGDALHDRLGELREHRDTAGRHHRSGCGACWQDGRGDGVGRRERIRPSAPGPGRRLPQLHRGRGIHAQLRHSGETRAAPACSGWQYQQRGARSMRSGLDNVPASFSTTRVVGEPVFTGHASSQIGCGARPAGTSMLYDSSSTTLRAPVNTTACWSSRRARQHRQRKTAARRRDLAKGSVGGQQGHTYPARSPTGPGASSEGASRSHSDLTQRISPLLHLGPARECDVQRAGSLA